MNEKLMELETLLEGLKIKLSIEEFSHFMIERDLTEAQLDSIVQAFDFIKKKKEESSVAFLYKCSRLPQKIRKTFDNFNFEDVHGKDCERLKSLRTLSPVYARKNLVFIGPPGTGKTHLAMAFGTECCRKMLKTYFLNMAELNEMLTLARQSGRGARLMSTLVKPTCLIIDEVGHCVFDRENTRLFFDMVNRRYNKDCNSNMVFTSNYQPFAWRECFTETNSLLCALDRIFDNSLTFNFSGESHRGLNNEVLSFTTKRARSILPLQPQID